MTIKLLVAMLQTLINNKENIMSTTDKILTMFQEQQEEILDLKIKLTEALDRVKELEENIAYLERDVDRGYVLEDK